MNRKLVNGLLLVALASGGCGVFTSCKDTDDDYYSGVIKGQVSLEQQLKDLKEELGQYAKKTDLDNAKQEILSKLNEEIDKLANIYATKDELNGVKQALTTEINKLVDAIDGEGGIKSRLSDVETGLSDLQRDYAVTAGEVAAMKTLLYGDEENPGGLVGQVSKLLEDVANNQEDIENLYQLIADHKQEFEQLQGQLAYYINSLNNRLDNTITDIILNQAWNPMFGSINLPVGLSTSIAANYYGKSDVTLNFPLGAPGRDVLQGYEAIGEARINDLLSALNGEQEVVTGGKIYMNTTEIDGVEYGKLGQLYLTINPNTANISGTTFDLVTSSGATEVPIKVVVSETDEELKFGVNVTRSAANGFYRADLYVKPEDATKITIDIENGLKSAMKDALLNHTKSDFVQLGKLLMAQMKDFLPAYGVKATWYTDNTTFLPSEWDAQHAVEHTYFGKYEIAATAIRPLSFEFMHGQGASKDLLPTVGSLKDAFDRVFAEFNFEINTGITGINAPTFNIDLSKAKLEFKKTQIEVNLDGLEVNGQPVAFKDGSQKIILTYEPDGTVKGNTGALNGLIDQIAQQVNDMLAGKLPSGELDPNSIQGQIQNGIISQVDKMVKDINSQLANVNGNIQNSVDKIVENIKNTLLGKLGRVDNLVDKYNALATRINDLLKDPNHYLQVMMAYQAANGNLGILSSDINYPTAFNQAGGNAIELFATSYTAELIAPAYKKYVAVSRAWKADGTEVAFADGVKAANQTPYLNEVRPGNQQRFAINTANLQPGYKYEIVYSALDYRGYTSTRLFYITVAE